MAEIEIDGKKVKVEQGSMIIEAAAEINIEIPRFCYHNKLSIAANCRMCLVEVEKSPKPLPACATPVTEGMKVWTKSKKAIEAQKSVMEFLLINHPLDCPICDQGGECELQDVSMGYGSDFSRFHEGKRVVKDKNLGPLISTDMTRCIHCTRCVRFGSEIAGVREMGATCRGEHMEIGTFIEQNIDSEVSGNIIDLCPVGALNSKPFRFRARGWELKKLPTISPHDGWGTHIYAHTKQNKVMRVVPKEEESINEVWISDRDRFSYEGLYSPDRLTQPKIKKDGDWQTVSWEEALDFAAQGLRKVINESGVEEIGALFSPNCTLEEFYLGQKLLRGIGVSHLDHRVHQTDFRHQEHHPLFPNLGLSIEDIENQDVILLVGSNPRKEQPLFALRLRKMALAEGKVLCVNAADYPFNFQVTNKKIVESGNLVLGLCGIVKALLKHSSSTGSSQENNKNINPEELPWLSRIKDNEVDEAMADILIKKGKKAILLGFDALSHPESSEILALACLISKLTGATVGTLNSGANSAGGALAGFLPHRGVNGISLSQPGFQVQELWDKKLKSYFVVGLEPDLDCVEGKKAIQALHRAQFNVFFTSYDTEMLQTIAQVLLPMTPFTENEGTYVNLEGVQQTFKAVSMPYEESKPAWKILRVLANKLEVAGFDYENLSQVQAELNKLIPKDKEGMKGDWNQYPIQNFKPTLRHVENKDDIIRLAPIPLYLSDPIVRRATSLQKTTERENAGCLRLNTSLANKYKLKEGVRARLVHQGAHCLLPVLLDESVANNTVIVAMGLKETVNLGSPYGVVEIYAE